MRFGTVPAADAEGTVLAHSLKSGTLRFKKGRLLGADDIKALVAGGVRDVIAARLEPGDILEDEAAARLAGAMTGAGLDAGQAATGRVNLFAAHAGLFRADRQAVDRLNRIDPAITFACLADRAPVRRGDMVATIKIIPLAVSNAVLDAGLAAIAAPGVAWVTPFRPMRVALLSTTLPSLKPSVMDKTARLLADRLAPSASRLTGEERVPHKVAPLADAIARAAAANDLVVVFGASAVVDRQDVIPAAIEQAGGEIIQVGMPVDPGNLLVLGRLAGKPVMGAPGCARSAKENGFDWVLNRIVAGEDPDSDDITGMGVGGLLMEIPSRPQPRLGRDGTDLAVDAVMLAAGRARRMGKAHGHKLLACFDGVPLVRRAVEAAIASAVRKVHVITGYRAEEIEAVLSGLDVALTRNDGYASGMASSLAAGLARLPADAAGALILLADMPQITADHCDRLIAAFRAHHGRAVVRAVSHAKRGNPVILPRAAFEAAMDLSGDVGARPIVESGAFEVIDVELGEAAEIDVDTPEAVIKAGGQLER